MLVSGELRCAFVPLCGLYPVLILISAPTADTDTDSIALCLMAL